MPMDPMGYDGTYCKYPKEIDLKEKRIELNT